MFLPGWLIWGLQDLAGLWVLGGQDEATIFFWVKRFFGVLARLGFWQKEATILFLGTDDEGRIWLLHMLKDEAWTYQSSKTYSAPGRLRFGLFGKIKFKAVDLGEFQIARRVLRDYNYKVDALVYVIDSNSRLGISHLEIRELDALLSDEALAGVPFLILDKMNGATFASEDELCSKLDLTNLTTGKGKVNLADSNVRRPLEVFICSRSIWKRRNELLGGYRDAFEWLSKCIK